MSSSTVSRESRPIPNGYFIGLKNLGPVPWHKRITLDFLHLLETDPSIDDYSRFPERLVIKHDGELREHWIGFVVLRGPERAYVDIDAGQNPDSWFEGVADICAASGIRYEVVTAADIRTEPRLSNAKAIVATRHVAVPKSFIFDAKAAIADGATTLGDLCTALSNWPDTMRLAQAAALRGHLKLDLAAVPLGVATQVWA